MIKLHLGCGARDFSNAWIHVDGGNYPHVDYHNITHLPSEDNEVGIIYNSHVLEYFDREEVIPVLKEWYRVLKPGGILRTAVPDFEAMSYLYTEDGYRLKNFLGPIFGKMKMGDKTIYHKTVYDFEDLREVLESVGFKNIQRYDRWGTEHASTDDCSAAFIPKMDFKNGTLISLNVEALK